MGSRARCPHLRRRTFGVRRQSPRRESRARPASSVGAVRGRAGAAAGGHRRPHRAAHACLRTGSSVHRASCHRVDAQSCTDRPTAVALMTPLRRCAPDLDPAVAHGLLDLGVDSLAGSHRRHDRCRRGGIPLASLDVATKFRAPQRRSPTARTSPRCSPRRSRRPGDPRHGRRSVEYLGIGLRSSAEAERHVGIDRGIDTARRSASATSTRRRPSP